MSADQFQRLVHQQTVSSVARRLATATQKASTASGTQRPDSLDLALASTYDHHAVWGADKAFVVRQTRHCLENHAGEWSTRSLEQMDGNGKEGGYSENRPGYRNDNYHVQLGIPPYHTSSSRRGYGRGPDGCFYSA